MADSQFFKDLAKLDWDIADRWKRLTKDNPKAIVDKQGVVTILRDVLAFDYPKTHMITQGQAEAIVKLLDNAKFDRLSTKVWLLDLIELAVELRYFERGAGYAADLKDVTTALGHGNVGKINFISPKTKMRYTSILYEGVLDLVADKKIKVVEVHAAGLNLRCSRCGKGRKPGKGGVGGSYHGVDNELNVYQGLGPNTKTTLIVHEATHVIQDWTDEPMSHFEAEADAYIAGGVVALGLGQNVFKQNNRYGLRLENAAGMVLRGRATAGNKAWEQAYDDLVAVVSQDSLYAEKKGMYFNADEPVTKNPEKVKWADILTKVHQRKQASKGKPTP